MVEAYEIMQDIVLAVAALRDDLNQMAMDMAARGVTQPQQHGYPQSLSSFHADLDARAEHISRISARLMNARVAVDETHPARAFVPVVRLTLT